MSKELIQADYQGQAIAFTGEAWFNATAVAARFDKRVGDWLDLASTKEYIAALAADTETGKSGFVKSKRGGDVTAQGTWFHPELAVAFARWLDVRFGIWCDRQIKAILTNPIPSKDWLLFRREAAGRYSVMSEVLMESRTDLGKETKPFHYSNEALMINEVLTGDRKAVNRDSLSHLDLRLLARLESKNTVLIGRDYPYQYRKAILLRFVAEERARLMPKLEGSK